MSPTSPSTPPELTQVEQLPTPSRWKTARHAIGRAYRTTREAMEVQIEGASLPDGPAILACNHLRSNDFARLSSVIGRPLHLATADPGRFSRREIAIDTPDQGAMDASAVLHQGGMVVIFPEGSPSPDGRLHRGNPDVAWLALTTRVPVVPIGIVAPPAKGLAKPILTRVLGPTIRCGEAIDFTRYWNQPALSDALDGVLLRGATDEVMAAIAELSGQLYDDLSIDEAKTRLAEERRYADWARAKEYPTVAEQRRAAAERREAQREAEERDLERAAAEARAYAQAHSHDVVSRSGGDPAYDLYDNPVHTPAPRPERSPNQHETEGSVSHPATSEASPPAAPRRLDPDPAGYDEVYGDD